MKVKVERQGDGQTWRSVTVDVHVSLKGNFTFKHDGRVYVFRQKKEGEEVRVLENGKWLKAGRIAHGDVFLGPGISYDEYVATPEGMKNVKAALESFLADRR